jgi:hypothetical protein
MRPPGSWSNCWKTIIAEADDLIESRSPKLVAQAALRHFSDEAPRQAE